MVAAIVDCSFCSGESQRNPSSVPVLVLVASISFLRASSTRFRASAAFTSAGVGLRGATPSLSSVCPNGLFGSGPSSPLTGAGTLIFGAGAAAFFGAGAAALFGADAAGFWAVGAVPAEMLRAALSSVPTVGLTGVVARITSDGMAAAGLFAAGFGADAAAGVFGAVAFFASVVFFTAVVLAAAAVFFGAAGAAAFFPAAGAAFFAAGAAFFAAGAAAFFAAGAGAFFAGGAAVVFAAGAVPAEMFRAALISVPTAGLTAVVAPISSGRIDAAAGAAFFAAGAAFFAAAGVGAGGEGFAATLGLAARAAGGRATTSAALAMPAPASRVRRDMGNTRPRKGILS